jgi:hypothetical protein
MVDFGPAAATILANLETDLPMTFTRRRKFVLTALLLYWPAIFTLTHMPATVIPGWFIRTQLGDKTPHFLAYLGLVFLWWFAMNPYKRVNWFKWSVWVTIGAMAIYGTLDEWLQGFVHRNPDVWDFAADMAGVTCGLLLLTLLDFWAAAIVVGSGVIFGATALMHIDIVEMMPATSPVFFLIAYAMIAACWVNHLGRRYRFHPRHHLWLPMALLLPLALLAATHTYAAIAVHRYHISPIIAALAGITAVIGTAWIAGLWQHHDPAQG